ncbi:MAG: prepilin peptidase [Phycisphaerae bacterium]|nr:prepilin peptidase [Phycisphaerae bacterium]
MLIPAWILFAFILAFGCCIGSFLNVVIYRMPREKSIVSPPSSCPSCNKRIAFYDNIPLISWLILGGKCRNCKARISPRYFVIELLTGLTFVGIFYLFFYSNLRAGMPELLGGGWLIYAVTMCMLAAFIAGSAIDLELWVIPLSICWFVTLAGLVGSSVSVFFVDFNLISQYVLLPMASAKTAAIAFGALVGLIISLILLFTGVIKTSYAEDDLGPDSEENQPVYNHRLEALKEIVFLLPVIICSVGFYLLVKKNVGINGWWIDFSQKPVISGFFGSLFGYFVGCAVVWATRILGTFAFGKEAMGLGDVHLMGAAGAVIGPVFVTAAFFIAPFFGLLWAGIQMFSKKTRQIPYGPFLSLGVLIVIIFHDWILAYLTNMFYY